MDQELIKTLASVGLNKKEATVYLAFLELGKGTVYQAAKLTNLNRPIVYVIAEKLFENGCLMKFPEKKITSYQATEPTVIFRKLQNSTKNFFEMLPIFETLVNKTKEKPQITYTESKEGILNAYEKLNNYKDQFYLSSYVRLEETFPGILDNWVKNYRRNRIKIKGRHLMPDNPKEREFAKKFINIDQEVRFSKEIINTNMDFAICGDTLTITSLGKNIFTISVKSGDITSSLFPLFEALWKKAKNT